MVISPLCIVWQQKYVHLFKESNFKLWLRNTTATKCQQWIHWPQSTVKTFMIQHFTAALGSILGHMARNTISTLGGFEG